MSFECDNVPFEDEVLDDVEEYELGDTIIATDVALAQTEEYGTTLEEEVTTLTIHSLLHLCGYDHIEDDDYEIMHALEEKLMREIEPEPRMTREGFSLLPALPVVPGAVIIEHELHERNFHIEFACMLLCIALGFGFGINPYEWLAVVVCFGLVLGGECLNSSIERNS